MDFIEPIWAFAPGWKVRILVLIVLAQMALVVRCYGAMSNARMSAAKQGRVTADVYRATQSEPEELAVYTRLVANQFEAPVLFYAVIAMALALGVTSWITVVLAAIFVISRWQHAGEMMGEHDVMKRRKLFIRSFTVLIALMAEFALSTLLWA